MIRATLLVFAAFTFGACTAEVENFHFARMNSFVAAAQLSRGQSDRSLDTLKQRNHDIEQKLISMRRLVERSENKAELCENKADELARSTGTYSKIR